MKDTLAKKISEFVEKWAPEKKGGEFMDDLASLLTDACWLRGEVHDRLLAENGVDVAKSSEMIEKIKELFVTAIKIHEHGSKTPCWKWRLNAASYLVHSAGIHTFLYPKILEALRKYDGKVGK